MGRKRKTLEETVHISMRIKKSLFDSLKIMAIVERKSITDICTESFESYIIPRIGEYKEISDKIKQIEKKKGA